jgi:hexosaminidase
MGQRQCRSVLAAVLIASAVARYAAAATTPAPARPDPTPRGESQPAAGGAQAPAPAATTPATAAAVISVLPQPASLTVQSGVFTLKRDTTIATDVDTQPVGQLLAQALNNATRFALRARAGTSAPDKNAIVITTDRQLSQLGEEGYQLEVTPDRVMIRSFGPAGAFYGMQTLRQLLPPQIFSQDFVASIANWNIPCLKIEDGPRFVWRGLLIDVSRRFVAKAALLKFIDVMALHKLNMLQLHLADDQGWRLEIKKYPKLTAVGSVRKETRVGHEDKSKLFDGTPYGGFYTQGDIREIVAYAKARFITIVPEITMPGHEQAAIAAYPELGNTTEPVEVSTHWGVHTRLLNPAEPTMQFLQDVMTEVLLLFPSRYIHVGGDEAIKDEWKASAAAQTRMKDLNLKDEKELQGYFIRRMDAFLTQRGRRLVGWEEIRDGFLTPSAVVMAWHGTDSAIAAARSGHDVVMAPTSATNFDYYQSKGAGEPLASGSFLPVDKVYAFEPVPPGLSAEEAKHVLGAQGQLWTEYINNASNLEYMAFPRAVALAEVTWSQADRRNYADFRARMQAHEQRLKLLGVNFRPMAKPDAER